MDHEANGDGSTNVTWISITKYDLRRIISRCRAVLMLIIQKSSTYQSLIGDLAIVAAEYHISFVAHSICPLQAGFSSILTFLSVETRTSQILR